jgi:ribosome-binding factor A
MKKNRQERLADLLIREISDILLKEVKDPRVGFITLTKVNLSRDLKHAKVYFSMMEESQAKKEETVTALGKAAGFIRYRLYKTLRLKYSPEIEFTLDDSLQKADRIEKALKDITTQDEQQ